ncbi:MAG: glutamyl-tRNA reductase [Chloroflexi bacterium]|nr:glutamyl-tRNA reductase [Chloroflexota bacterium]
MPILVLGLSHKETPVVLRERLAFRADDLPAALRALRDYVSEGAILSTCNRTEVYALVGHRDTGLRAVRRFLADWHHLQPSDLALPLYERWQEEAVRHLFRVASGLDSMILGEPQILGQVKRAREAALACESLGAVLERLVRQAVEVGKRARTQTGISRNAVSVPSAAVELARRSLGSLQQARMLVVGAGEMGKLAALALADQGAGEVIVTSRSPANARRLADAVRGAPVAFAALPDELARADVVLSCTSAPVYVIGLEMVQRAMGSRRGRPLALIDIAVPRDVDPRAREMDGVYLYNVDDLEAVCAANLELRRAEAAQVEAIIEREVPRFMQWWDTLDVVPTIAALVDRAEAIRQAELARALPRLGELSERQRSTINALTAAIVQKMLHQPIARLKDHGEGEDGRLFVPAVRELFQLDGRQ